MSPIRTISAAVLLLLASSVCAAAGNSPSEAYLEFHKVLKQSFSEQSIWPYYLKSARQEFEEQFPPDMRGRAFFLMKSAAPTTVRIDKEVVSGDTATLTLIPTSSGKTVSGEAVMRLEDGAWKVEKVVWQAR